MSSSYSSLGQVAEFINGFAFGPDEWGSAGLPIIRIQNLTSKDKPFTRTTAKVADKYRVNQGDLLVSWSATLGVFEWDREECGLVNQHIFRVVPKEQIAFRPYLKHVMAQAITSMARFSHGSTMRHINREEFLNTRIWLPTLDEQQRIAAILDKADVIRRKREQAIKLADEFLRSLFLDMFGDPGSNPKGWPVRPLSWSFDTKRAGTKCGPFGSALKKDQYRERGVPVWGIDNVLPNQFRSENSLFISEDKYRALQGYDVLEGDILISRAGTVGRMCVVEQYCGPSIIGTNLIRLSLDKNLLSPRYFTALFTFFADRLKNVRANAKVDAYSFMNTGVLASLQIPVPPPILQQSYVSSLQKIDGIKQGFAKAETQHREFSSSLAFKAFRGEL